MASIPLIGEFTPAVEREILKYLTQDELVTFGSSFLEERIKSAVRSLIKESNDAVRALGEAVAELKAHPDFQVTDCKADTILDIVKHEAEQSRKLNALFHKALLNYALKGEKSLIPDHFDDPIVKQLKDLYAQKKGRIAEVALASLAASPGICNICTQREGGGRPILCIAVHISLFGPNMQQEIYTVHVAATKNLKEGTATDLALIDERGETQVYWVLPVQEKQHHSFPKLFPQGPFHKAHAKMVASAYKTLCE